MIDQQGLDTELARLLHQNGRVEVETLQRLLAEARQERPGGVTLARSLVGAGELAPEEVSRVLAGLAAGRDSGPTGTQFAHADSGPTGTEFGPRGSSGPTGTEYSSSLGDSTEQFGAETWQRGTRVGDYRILEALGRGAMGRVYVAEHVETGGKYAIKTISRSAGKELTERFRREGEAQAKVDGHPNVLRIHSMGEAQGRPYIVTELATGGDLETRLRREGALPPEEAARLIRDVALGLAHMHGQGVVHRDLKPANVLLEEGVPKVMDFGLARWEGVDSLTRTGDLVGTPSYMAPEQAGGHHEKVGPWTDVYALGAILYTLLTGRCAFLGATSLDVLTQVIEDSPPTPRSLRAEIPPALEAICLKAMGKLPEQRYRAQGLAADLDRFLNGELEEAPSRHGRLVSVLGSLALLTSFAALAAIALSRDGPGPNAPVEHEAVAAAPSAVVTESAAPKAEERASPSPEQEDEDALSWRWREGDVERYRLSLSRETRSGSQHFEELRRFDFTWRAAKRGAKQVTIEATIDGLVVSQRMQREDQRRGLRHDVRFDSERNPDHELARAVGKTFVFDMDPATGAVLQVRDVDVIQEAIYGELEWEEDWRTMAALTVPELSTASMVALLASVLRVLPRHAVDADPWKHPRPLVTRSSLFEGWRERWGGWDRDDDDHDHDRRRRGRRDRDRDEEREKSPNEVYAGVFELAPGLEGLQAGQVGIVWEGMAPDASESRLLKGSAAFLEGRLHWSRYTEQLSGRDARRNLPGGGRDWGRRRGRSSSDEAAARSRTTVELTLLPQKKG